VYYDKFPGDQDWNVLAVEQPFSFNLPGLPVPIIGVWDLVEMDPSGTVVIVDFKSSKKAFSTEQVDKNLQMGLYQMAAKANGYADRDILLRFDVLIKTTKPRFEQYYSTRSELDLKRIQRQMIEVWSAISKGVFIPRESWKCKGCAYQKACAEWFEQEADLPAFG